MTTTEDQNHRMTPVEALTQIRALCVPLSEAPERPIPGRDEWEHGFAAGQTALAQTIRAVLDAVSVDATPAQDIDRDALLDVVRANVNRLQGDRVVSDAEVVDRILALVRPVEGVVLSREEKALIIDVLNEIPDMDLRMAQIRPSRQQEIDERGALAARLEATTEGESE